jgi:hypothetical protein
MIWFFTRDRDSLQLETRYDNETLEYVGIVTHPDGHRQVTRFAVLDEFRAWLETFEHGLEEEHWSRKGGPQIVADGWPDKPPRK